MSDTTHHGGEDHASPLGRLRRVAAEWGPTGQQRPPIVDEVQDLADLLDLVGLVDRVVAEVVDRLIDLRTTGAVGAATGVDVDAWLTHAAHRTHADVRMLSCAADLLPRLPGIHQAFSAGQLSWSQVRAVLLETRKLPLGRLDEVDALVCAWVDHAPDADPDAVTHGIATLAWQLDTARRASRLEADERHAEASQFVAMQPRIDGTGGRIWGDLAADGFATLDAALNHDLTIPAGRGDFDDPGDRPRQAAAAGRQRAHRLIGWANHHLTGCGPAMGHDSDADPESVSANGQAAAGAARAGAMPRDGRAGRARATVLLRTSLDTLLGGDLPGELLTHLTGGRLHVTSSTARRIVDEGGADLRLIVLDDTGSVVGVGDRTRVPPGWVSDAGLALTATCEVPGCRAPARVSQDDHARPWHPRSPNGRRGTTDVGNVGPLCARHNRAKELAGWLAQRSPDGVRRWHHPRSGLTATHLPDDWLPPPPAAPPSAGPAPPREPPDDQPRDRSPDDTTDALHDAADEADRTVQEWLEPPDPDLPF